MKYKIKRIKERILKYVLESHRVLPGLKSKMAFFCRALNEEDLVEWELQLISQVRNSP